MPFETLVLYGIGLVLLALAVAAGYYMLLEVMQLFRDVFRNRRGEGGGFDQPSAPARRIIPFRDRGTVERLIGYFTRQDKR